VREECTERLLGSGRPRGPLGNLAKGQRRRSVLSVEDIDGAPGVSALRRGAVIVGTVIDDDLPYC